MIAIAYEETARICSVLVDPIPARILCKETCSLDPDFLPASFLGCRSRRAHQESQNRCHYNFPNHVFFSLRWILPDNKKSIKLRLRLTASAPDGLVTVAASIQ